MARREPRLGRVTETPRPAGARLAVLGSPIEHSRSPALHGAASRALGFGWEYTAIELGETGLAGFLDTRDAAWRGFSATMPLKHELLRLADERDATSRLTGVANTLVFDGPTRRRHVFNTDVAGIVRALAEEGVHRASRVVVLGGGATAASAVVAAAELGAEHVHVAVRTPQRAEPLKQVGRAAGVAVGIGPLASLAEAGPAELVIGTLPGGVELGSPLPEGLRRSAVLFDVAYAPWPSALARSWESAGGRAVSGLGMLLHQALVQVRLFAGGDPFAELPDEQSVLGAMRAALA